MHPVFFSPIKHHNDTCFVESWTLYYSFIAIYFYSCQLIIWLNYLYTRLCLNFFQLLARKLNLEKISMYSNKFFHNFHMSESSFTCPGLQASELAQRLVYWKIYLHPNYCLSFYDLIFISWYRKEKQTINNFLYLEVVFC